MCESSKHGSVSIQIDKNAEGMSTHYSNLKLASIKADKRSKISMQLEYDRESPLRLTV